MEYLPAVCRLDDDRPLSVIEQLTLAALDRACRDVPICNHCGHWSPFPLRLAH